MDNYGQLFNAAVASQLRAERAARGMTVARLVTATGISKRQMLRLLHAEANIDTLDIALIARALSIEPATLIARAQARMQEESPTTQGTTPQA